MYSEDAFGGRLQAKIVPLSIARCFKGLARMGLLWLASSGGGFDGELVEPSITDGFPCERLQTPPTGVVRRRPRRGYSEDGIVPTPFRLNRLDYAIDFSR